jgi:hypothetical protein
MNKLYRFCFFVLLVTVITSCNNSSTTENQNGTDSIAIDTVGKAVELMPVITEETKLAPNEISLTQADFPVVVTVPENFDPTKVKVEAQTWGGVEITAGENFQIQIASGQGDMTTRKSDLAADDVYKVDYIVDEKNAIVYKKYIPDTDIQEYHFYIIAKTGKGYYEVEDIPGTQFSKKSILNMYEAAKKLKSIKG